MMRSTFQQEVMGILGILENETLPVPFEMQRQFYATAFGLYEKGDYRGASQLFTQLVLTDPYSKPFTMPNFDPLSTLRPTISISSTPSLEALRHQHSLTSDSIKSIDRDPHSVWTPERPVLTPPNLLPSLSDSVYRLVSTTEES